MSSRITSDNSGNNELVRYLRQIATFFAPPMCPLERFILECGTDFIPMKRPKGVRKQADKQCFTNTYRLVEARPELEYVEGYAVHADLGFPMLHAWAVGEGRVIDPTWRCPEKSCYRGVVIPMRTVRKEMLRNRVYGVLDPGFPNMELIEQLRKEYAKCGKSNGSQQSLLADQLTKS